MPANYPASLPSASPADHAAVNDELVAIATELGTEPSGGAATVKAAIEAVSRVEVDGVFVPTFEVDSSAVPAGDITVTPTGGIAATDVQAALAELDSEKATVATAKAEVIGVALSDETTAITTGTAKATIRMPFAMTLTAVRASLTTVSSSGIPTVDINEAGVSVLSTKLTIDASEKTSTTAATAAVISDSALADDAEITFDVDVAGTGAAGLKVWLIGTRA